MPTIAMQIEEVQLRVDNSQDDVEAIDKRLRLERMSEATRSALEAENARLQEVVATDEKELKQLRSENRQTLMFSAFILFFIYLFYYGVWQE